MSRSASAELIPLEQLMRTPSPSLPVSPDEMAARMGEVTGLVEEGRECRKLTKALSLLERAKIGHPREDIKAVRWVFIMIFTTSVFINYDSGAVPAVLGEIEGEFQMSFFGLGLLGALPYIGLTCASMIVGKLLQGHRQRRLLFGTMVLNVLACLLLALSFRDWMVFASRFLIGFTQAAFVVYAPVWIDEFAPAHKVTMWMGLLQAAAVIGVMVGYLLAGFLSRYALDWRYSIGIQAITLGPLTGSLLSTPGKYINIPSHEQLNAAMFRVARANEELEMQKNLAAAGGCSSCGLRPEESKPDRTSVDSPYRSPETKWPSYVSEQSGDSPIELCPSTISALPDEHVLSLIGVQLPRSVSLKPHTEETTVNPGETREDVVDSTNDACAALASSSSCNGLTKRKNTPTSRLSLSPGAQGIEKPRASAALQHGTAASTTEENDLHRSAFHERSDLWNFSPWIKSLTRWEAMSNAPSNHEFPHIFSRRVPRVISSDITEGSVSSRVSSRPSMSLLAGTPSAAIYAPLRLSNSQGQTIPDDGVPEDMYNSQPHFQTNNNSINSGKGGRTQLKKSSCNARPDKIPEAVDLEEAAERETLQKAARIKSKDQVMILLRNPLYMCMVTALCALYFVVTGIQFWTTKYFVDVLHVDKGVVLGFFAGTAASAPTLGVLIGGIFIDYCGGYRSDSGTVLTLLTCGGFATVATVCGVTITLLPVSAHWGIVMALIWLLLFFGGAILPPATGVLIYTVPLQLRSFASAFSMFTYNVFGYAAGAALPGAVMSASNGSLKRGMTMILVWPIFGLAGMGAATTVAIRRKKLSQLKDNAFPIYDSGDAITDEEHQVFNIQRANSPSPAGAAEII